MKRGARSFGKQRGRDCEQRAYTRNEAGEKKCERERGRERKTEREKERMEALGARTRLHDAACSGG